MKRFKFLLSAHTAVLMILWTFSASSLNFALAQQPTLTPTPQGPSTGVYITVITEEPQINVRMGPGSSVYPVVGTLVRGATAAALGRSPGGDWIQIEYAGAPGNRGWVYSPLVQITGGALQIVEPPPTPVPPATATIDPTLIAQFNVEPTRTRLPTFTPPPSLAAPTFSEPTVADDPDSIPLAVLIISLGSLGIVSLIGSAFFRRR